jgi:hypothetical protein
MVVVGSVLRFGVVGKKESESEGKMVSQEKIGRDMMVRSSAMM